MLESLFGSVLTDEAVNFSAGSFLLCTAVSLALGAAISAAYMFRSNSSRGFAMTLALLPAIVQTVIMLVNGSIGAGVAVMGAFSLVRFRSAPGGGKEICCIFLAMAAGLATGMGYLAAAALFVIIVALAMAALTACGFGAARHTEKELTVTVPESLDYSDELDGVIAGFTRQHELVSVKTTAMGSLYKLKYKLIMKDPKLERALIDELRCHNGNLEIKLAIAPTRADSL